MSERIIETDPLVAYLALEWEEIEISPEDNTSVISWTLYFNSLKNDNSCSRALTSTVTIEGSTSSGVLTQGTYPIGEYYLDSGTKKIKHNVDGSKTINISISLTGSPYATWDTMRGSWTRELTVISRKATITSAPNFTDEENPTIYYNNPAQNGVTSLQACISSTGEEPDIAYYRDIEKTGSSYTFELTNEEKNRLYDLVPSGNTATVYFYVRTIVDGIYYFSYIAKTFTIANPKPEVVATIYDENRTTRTLTGYAEGQERFVKYHSNASWTIQGVPKKGATIKGTSVRNSAQTYINTPSGVFNAIESAEFTYMVTDSRGYTTTVTREYELIPYVPLTANLKIDSFTATGEMKITITGKYFSGSFGAQDNSMSAVVRLYDTEDELLREIDLASVYPTVDNMSNYTYSHTLTGVDHRQSYIVRVEVADRLTPAISLSTVAAPIPIFEWGKEDFNFNVPVSIQGERIADFVVEVGQETMGTNGVWYWAKWNSGKAECYGCRNYGNMGVTTTWGGLYRSEVFTQSYPSGLFKSAPESTSITLRQGSYGGWIVTHEQSAPSADSSGSFIVVRPASANISQAYISFYSVGRWK